MRTGFFSFFLLLLLLSACQSKVSSGDKSVTGIPLDGSVRNSEIIRSPATASKVMDTVNVARMEFEAPIFDFGTVAEGDIVEHVFRFKNTGKVPLLITNARSTCGCTVPEWPKDPVEPGAEGSINVRFNTENKKENQRKPVTITANTYPASTKVYLKGFVEPKTENQ